MHDPAATPATRTLASRSCPLVALLIAIAGCSTSPTALRVQPPSASTGTPTPTLTPTPASSGWQLSRGESLIAVARHSSLSVRLRPDGPVKWRLSNPNESGARLVVLVLAQNASGWNIRVPSRPNGAAGWVADSEITLEADPYALRVSLARHTLSVYEDGRRVRLFAIGVGRPSAPTPTGTFFLTELLEAANPNGPYGAFAYGTSAFSDVFSEFEGGPGQIGVHGTNDPSSIGRDVSHGCIRLGEQDIRALAHMVPAGTPLVITP